MTEIKIEPDGLLTPPQYLDGLGPTAIVRRIKGASSWSRGIKPWHAKNSER